MIWFIGNMSYTQPHETTMNQKQNKPFFQGWRKHIYEMRPLLVNTLLVVAIVILALPLVNGVLLGSAGLSGSGHENVNTTATGIVLNQLNGIQNDALLTLLSLLIAFAGLLAYVFKTLIKRDFDVQIKENRRIFKETIKEARSNFVREIHKVKKHFYTEINRIDALHKSEVEKEKEKLEDERFATNASAKNSTVATLLFLYIYQDGDPPFGDDYRKKILDMALANSRKAIEQVNSISIKNKNAHKETALLCFNDFCFALAIKAAKYGHYHGYSKDKEKAREYSEKFKDSVDIEYRATRALVLWIFHDEESEKIEAHKIIHEIKSLTIEGESVEELLKDIWKPVFNGDKKLPCDDVNYCGSISTSQIPHQN